MTTAAERLASLSGVLTGTNTVPIAQVPHTHAGAGLTKLAAQAIAVTQTTIAHGLAGTPTVVIISPRGVSFVFESQSADGTNVYMTTADIYVAL